MQSILVTTCLNVDFVKLGRFAGQFSILFRSSAKLVKALLDGSAHVERETIAKLKDALGFPKSQGFQSFGGAFPYPVPFPVASFQQQVSISSTFYMRFFCRYLGAINLQSQNVTREKLLNR